MDWDWYKLLSPSAKADWNTAALDTAARLFWKKGPMPIGPALKQSIKNFDAYKSTQLPIIVQYTGRGAAMQMRRFPGCRLPAADCQLFGNSTAYGDPSANGKMRNSGAGEGRTPRQESDTPLADVSACKASAHGSSAGSH